MNLASISTRRLVALVAAVVLVSAGGTALALAATGGGPVPSAKPLPQAVHDALAAAPVPGVTARIRFTNHLIDSGSLQGSDPILAGASGRLWMGAGHRFRLELQSDNGDAQVLSDGHAIWAYHPSSNTVYRATLPQDRAAASGAHAEKLPTVARIQSEITHLMQHANVSGATPGDVAGRPAYTVRITPRQTGGLLGAAELAWDSEHGVPLRAGIFARGSDSPVLELSATDISFGSVPASTFAISPPKYAKVVELTGPAEKAGAEPKAGSRHAAKRPSETVAQVQKALPFTLAAPARAGGLARSAVHSLRRNGKRAALVIYGEGLGAVAVLESRGGAGNATLPIKPKHEGEAGLSLPTVSVGGAKGQELDTALGTLIRFQRGGVVYTVVGSVSPAVARAAARSL